MGQVMFIHEATAILHRVPGIELRLNRNTVAYNPNVVPEIDVRYRGRSIGYIEKQEMDEEWHKEDPKTGKEFPKNTPVMQTSVMHCRAPWKQTMAVIAARINERDREILKRESAKRGFVWWRK